MNIIDQKEKKQLIDIDGFSLHMHCTGTGEPTVILDAGLNQPGNSWILVQREVEKFTQVCSYDRAGHGLSEASPNPRVSKKMAEELHALLHKARIQGPYLLVGHSFGGINIRTFAAMYPDEVMGMVLVDSSHEDQVLRIGNLSWPKPPLMNRVRDFLIKYFKFIDYSYYKKSIHAWPKFDLFSNEEWQYYINSMETYKHFSTVRQTAKLANQTRCELKKLNVNLGKKPLIVITRGKPDDILNKDSHFLKVKKVQEEIWLELQKELLKISSNSRHIIAHNSGHMIPFEEPKIISEAIREIVLQARKI